MLSKLLFAFLLLGIGLSIGLGYGHLQLEKERKVQQATVQEINGKVSLLKVKYSEKKALADQLMRTKYDLEGERRLLQNEIEELQKEKKTVKEKIENKTRSLETRIKELSEKCFSLQAKCEDIDRKYSQARQNIKNREEEIKQITAEKKTLQSELKRTNRSLDQCGSKNARLCIIADELIEKYQNKGVMGSILQKESLTGIKKVELEKFIQEYRDKIEEQRLEKKQEIR